MLRTGRHDRQIRNIRVTGLALATLAALATMPFTGHAQQIVQRLHLNPVIAKLAAGKTVYGLSTGDLSLPNARTMARSAVDFV
ncbi:MAG: hypothetical protein U0Q55_17865 [Vicinamibacterales bacterium]